MIRAAANRPVKRVRTKATKIRVGKVRSRRVATAVKITFRQRPAPPRVTVYRGKNQKDWYFRAQAKNGEIIATGEGYRRKWSAYRGAERTFPGAKITFATKG